MKSDMIAKRSRYNEMKSNFHEFPILKIGIAMMHNVCEYRYELPLGFHGGLTPQGGLIFCPSKSSNLLK